MPTARSQHVGTAGSAQSTERLEPTRKLGSVLPHRKAIFTFTQITRKMPAAVVDDPQSGGPDGIGKPPSNVVLPPKEIRNVVEKTAGYVVRNGTTFEDRIRQKEAANVKFSFLNPNDAYHSFYQWRMDEIRSGRGTAVSAGRAGELVTPVPQKPKGPEQPPDFHFSARMPIINAQDLEVIKLTALYAAKHGESFIRTLGQREATNFQFDFLRAQHTLHQFYQRLRDQYSVLLNAQGPDGGKAEQARIAELTKNVHDKFHLMGRAKQRAEWVKHQEKQKQEKEEAAEKEKLEYAQIDWHDFVVVETVLFTEADDETDLAPPTSLSDLQSASLEQKAMMSLAPSNRRIEEAMPTDSDVYYNGYGQPQQQPMPQYTPQPTPVNLPPPPSYPAQPSPAQVGPYAPPPTSTTPISAENDRLASRDAAASAQAAARGTANAPMKIRNDYVPRAAAARGRASVAICPNCNLPVPFAELEEHMRIELLDPRWKEQRAKAESHYATTNLSTADVANNLKRLASQRTDVFDPVTGLALSEEEAARRKRAAVAYAGMPGERPPIVAPVPGAVGQGMSIDQQLEYLRNKANQGS